MKKLAMVACLLMVGVGGNALANSTNLYNTGKGFVGAEVGLGGIGNVSLGVVGGYQFYFKEAWQFGGFRHGVRGIGTLNWTQYNGNSFFSGSSYNGIFVQAGADWTIDFNIKDRFVWGAYAGLSLGYLGLFSNGVAGVTPFVVSGNLGASVTIDKTHRAELALGSGFSIIALRYLYMF